MILLGREARFDGQDIHDGFLKAGSEGGYVGCTLLCRLGTHTGILADLLCSLGYLPPRQGPHKGALSTRPFPCAYPSATTRSLSRLLMLGDAFSQVEHSRF